MDYVLAKRLGKRNPSGIVFGHESMCRYETHTKVRSIYVYDKDMWYSMYNKEMLHIETV